MVIGLSLLLMLVVATVPVTADEVDPFDFDDFDALFDDPDMIDDLDEADMPDSPQDDLLKTAGVRWGGRITGSVSSDWNWTDVWTERFRVLEPDASSLSPRIGADLFFDARPQADFRAFGKLRIRTTSPGLAGLPAGIGVAGTDLLPEGWTAQTNDTGDIEIRNADGVLQFTIPGDTGQTGGPAVGTAPGLELSVFELFSDYSWRDALFFRFGKHTITWGTGYFFSPADVLNLTAIDAEDATADREGPISLRVAYPFGITGNAYLYLIPNADTTVLDVAVAPRVSSVLGSAEVSLAAYYQRALAPRFIALYSGSAGDIDLFGELVALWGSDRVFVRVAQDQSAATAEPEQPPHLVLETYTRDGGLLFQMTVGARYLHEWENGVSVALIGQYFASGEGYDASVPGLLPAAARLLLNPTENARYLPLADRTDEYESPPALRFRDLPNWGRHYAGITGSLSGLLTEDLTLSAFGLVNLSDLSGIVTPAISYRLLSRFTLTASARFTFGPADGELTAPAQLLSGGDARPTFGLTLNLSMPGRSF